MARLILRFTLFICLLCPMAVLAQTGVITGKVTAQGSNNPVAKASVFLNNASYGTATADDGTFALRGVKPGQYDLVVTILGYEEYNQKVQVNNNTVELNISLVPKVMMMREVVITSNADWKKNYEQFKKEFIGNDDAAKQCKVANPRILNLSYTRKTQTLEASTDEFLEVENYALGYKVKFLLAEFTSNNISGIISYAGKALFEDLPGSAEQKKKWKAKRDEAYYGSSRHFYRSLYKNRLQQEGFEIYDFMRSPDPHRAPEWLIKKKIKQFNGFNRDSAQFWINMENMPKWYQEHLTRPNLSAAAVLRKPAEEGIYVITFPHYLYVVYNKRLESQNFKDLYRPLDMPNYEASVITLNGDFAAFDMNGSVIMNAPLNEGTWTKSKLAAMLPVDYEPSDK
ncbi:carboxypeptidase-like regulatory domain-containing protein [Mucilaginibacter conchicola]|uniref:Carboxypeptidase-like regulatory domain-containing protein n=1 Tax=Mucilaginibacter conchicola TaxID=2303333 RepID=A0A372NRA4_9SPHI|nr:carboxypeptidase-like regulatory domain-containing protein [Mucilaginibacter conchicola]RFZ90895.1 carboxypeptidase-like regulatory domain-containing protein [Mucilaginibacter conchicola]